MAKLSFLIFLLLPVLLLKPALAAQLRLDFSQDNRTYVWNTRLDCDRKVEAGLSWAFTSSINSMLTKKSIFSNNQNRWQENGNVGLNLDYGFTGRLKIGAVFSQETNSLEQKKVTNSVYGITSEYDFLGVKLAQMLGGKNIDRRWEQGKRNDAGFNHQLEIAWSPQLFTGSTSHISVSQTSSRLSHVPLLERDLNLSFAKSFSRDDSLEFFYQEGWSKKGFYQGELTDSQIYTQRRTQRVISLRSSAVVPLQIKVDFDFDFTGNGYKYSGRPGAFSSVLSNNSSNSLSFNLRTERSFFKRLSLGGFYKYTQTEEDYSNNQRDQTMKGGELGGNLAMSISDLDSLHLIASIGVTSFYASQVSAQLNDRDIQTLFSWGDYRHVFSRFLSLRMEGGFRNFHQVYVSNRLSANNNHNQTYVLSPTLIWRPHFRLDIRQNYNIQANYIYYDYEKSKESTNNRLFRRASSGTNIDYSLTHRVIFGLGYTYKYEDYGQLIWKDQWVQRPSWERRTHTIDLSVKYAPSKSWDLVPQYTYESRRSWDHYTDVMTMERMRTLSDRFHRNMISLSCRHLTDDRNYLSFSWGTWVQKSTASAKETSNYATVSVSRIF
ncbi:MAG: hypothetical protein WCE90_13305 [Candidatus Zixiibacteriota bacterium]